MLLWLYGKLVVVWRGLHGTFVYKGIEAHMPTTVTEQQPVPPSQAAPESASFRRVLKNRNFVLLWLAQLISLTIMNAANFGIIVLVNDTTHSVLLAGLAIIAFTLPALPFSAIAGVAVDRLSKRKVLWISNVLRAVTMFLIVVSLLYSRNTLWPLYALTFMASLIGQFFTPAEGAAIPLLVGGTRTDAGPLAVQYHHDAVTGHRFPDFREYRVADISAFYTALAWPHAQRAFD